MSVFQSHLPGILSVIVVVDVVDVVAQAVIAAAQAVIGIS